MQNSRDESYHWKREENFLAIRETSSSLSDNNNPCRPFYKKIFRDRCNVIGSHHDAFLIFAHFAMSKNFAMSRTVDH